MKIDIDSAPIEEGLIRQIITRAQLHTRIDELYYEDHVRGHPFMHGGPWEVGIHLTSDEQPAQP